MDKFFNSAWRRSIVIRSILFFAAVSVTTFACGSVIRLNAGFESNTLAGNDDGSTGAIGLGFSVNFFGVNRSTAFVNNNGNITFGSALSTFTPFNLSTTNRQILAPFFADVDTRPVISEDVTYGTDTVNGRAAFGVNWINVGYFANQTNKLNSFQLVVIDRSDIAAGDFDFEFNYDKIQWETGGASGGVNGLGGESARAGWSNGNLNSLELTGSAVDGAFLDGGPNALISNRLNSSFDGRYVFQVRNGQVGNIPEPGSLLIWGMGLVALTGYQLRRRRG